MEESEAGREKFLLHPYAVFKSQYFEISAAHICSVKIQFLWNITLCCQVGEKSQNIQRAAGIYN